jgi:hypothetical protein
MAAAAMSIMAFARGIALRGGIAIGVGITDLFPNEVYGPVLSDAYALESSVAEYPRIAIGRSVVAYTHFIEDQAAGLPFADAIRRQVRLCRELICLAPDDGWPMLHFLSPSVQRDAPGFAFDRPSARAWVSEQVDTFGRSGNDKLFRRYQRLAAYFAQHPDDLETP